MSFTADTTVVNGVVRSILNAKNDIDKMIYGRMEEAVNLVYLQARQKRPMISQIQFQMEGRNLKGRNGKPVKNKVQRAHYMATRVSNPEAEAGVPVKTGALRASIKKEVTRKGQKVIGRIYTDLPYAAAMEFGFRVHGTPKLTAATGGMVPPRPFMRPALQSTFEEIKRLLRKRET